MQSTRYLVVGCCASVGNFICSDWQVGEFSFLSWFRNYLPHWRPSTIYLVVILLLSISCQPDIFRLACKWIHIPIIILKWLTLTAKYEISRCWASVGNYGISSSSRVSQKPKTYQTYKISRFGRVEKVQVILKCR